MARKKMRVGLIFGGRSGEHEVSLASATSVMANLDKDKYEVVPIGITKEGGWLLGTEPARLMAAEQDVTDEGSKGSTTAERLTSDPRLRRLSPLQEGEEREEKGALGVIFSGFNCTYGGDG